jgi:hypothetical protein
LGGNFIVKLMSMRLLIPILLGIYKDLAVLALLLQVHQHVFCHDVESLSVGAKTYMMALLAFMDRDFLVPLFSV